MSYHILTKDGCPYCTHTKALLDRHGIAYTVDHHDTEEKIEAFKAAGHRTFPRVFHEGVLVGGYDDLQEYLEV